jgi:hypothetical protein
MAQMCIPQSPCTSFIPGHFQSFSHDSVRISGSSILHPTPSILAFINIPYTLSLRSTSHLENSYSKPMWLADDSLKFDVSNLTFEVRELAVG